MEPYNLLATSMFFVLWGVGAVVLGGIADKLVSCFIVLKLDILIFYHFLLFSLKLSVTLRLLISSPNVRALSGRKTTWNAIGMQGSELKLEAGRRWDLEPWTQLGTGT